MGLRLIRLQGAVLAIGMFALYEFLLQTHMGWPQPFDQLFKYLEDHKEDALAEAFNDYRLAINVLKHGKGRSYDQLMAKSTKLEFRIRARDDPFFDEGDVSEIGILIDADDRFVRRCARVIEEASSVIRSNEQIWI